MRRTLALVLLAALCGSFAFSQDREIRLRSGTLASPDDTAGLHASLLSETESTEAHPRVVALAAPAGVEIRRALTSAGVRPVAALDAHSYVVWVPARAAAALDRVDAVAWHAPLHPGLRIAPEVEALTDEGDDAVFPTTLHLFGHADAQGVAMRLADAGVPISAVLDGAPAGEGTPERLGRIVALPSGSQLAQLRETIARWPETFWLARRPTYRLLNDESAWVGQAGLERPNETPVHDAGILGEGQIVGVLDTGIDADMCFFREEDGSLPPTVEGFGVGSPDLSRRKLVVVNFLWDQETPLDPNDWDTQDHGTHVAGSIAGDDLATPGVRDDADGMAPMAQLVVQDGGYATDDCADMPAIGCPAASLYPFFDQAYQQGARIHSNSYGDRENFTPYNIYSDGSEDADRFMRDNPEMLLVFAAGNNGPGSATVASPATAKNVLAVGATSHGSSAGSLASFSSQGPTHDGRIKPDVTIPGSSVISANNDGNIETDNCNTRSMSGTSMACPTAAGLAALVREYFADGFHPSGEENAADAFTPSAALVKAALVASATPMENVDAPPPSDPQGWGRILLDDVLYFPRDAKRLFVADERTGFSSPSDEPWEVTLDVLDASEPLRAVVTWTDEPSTPAASVNLINDLDLELVSPSGTVYRGNAFTDGASAPGGTADRVNNLEAVRIEDPEVGLWTMRVAPFAIPAPSQDFAAVATGRFPASGIVLDRTDLLLDDGVGGDADGVLEPGEWVDLVTTLMNSGDTLATNVRVRVETSSPWVEVIEAVGPVVDLESGQSATTVPAPRIRLSTDLPCTEPVVVTMHYEADGYADLETLELPTGTESVFLTDDFEGGTSWAHVAAESTASTGDWIVGDPNGTTHQPEDDATPDPGTRCLFTAQNSSVGTDDIDDGVVVARSGAYDLTGRPEARVRVTRWYANRDIGEDVGDFYRLEIREDAAAPDVLLEELGTDVSAARWATVSFRVADFVAPGAAVELKVSAADGAATGNIVEAAIDEIAFWEPACDVHDPPPNPVTTLLVERSDDDVVLRWTRPALDPLHGESSLYRVYRSEQVDTGFTERDAVSDPANEVSWTDTGAAGTTPRFFAYQVISENAQGASEPAP